MSNETKREVFEDTLDAYDDSRPYPHPGYDSPAKLLDRYNAALPDNLPVIPEAVGEYIRWCKGEGGIGNVCDAMGYAPTRIASWVYDERNSDVFALAWVLGVWRVEETGEIVKLEAEK
ncbi:hypothetical protein ACGRWF_05605 [Lacticaseibacillus paracasei]|uniref:hypothetical protein n=1 Tax=Lacticaseibacillus paracasei TaxID=1597 RepID=UPI00384A5B64